MLPTKSRAAAPPNSIFLSMIFPFIIKKVNNKVILYKITHDARTSCIPGQSTKKSFHIKRERGLFSTLFFSVT